MSNFMKIAIALNILGVLLCVTAMASGSMGRRRRRKPRRAPAGSSDQTPSNRTLNTATAINIENATRTSQPRAAAAAGAAGKRQRCDEHGRLVFIQEDRTRFEIEDLLQRPSLERGRRSRRPASGSRECGLGEACVHSP
jgi:hypothetical protein